MVKIINCLLVLILLLSVQSLWAELEELPEVQSDLLQDNWLKKLYEELDFPNHNIGINSRFHFSDNYKDALLSLKAKEGDILFYGNLYTTDEGPLLGNFILSRITPKNEIKEIHIGSYRPEWGCGAVLKKSTAANELFNVEKSPHPLYMSPLGVSMVMGRSDIYLYLMAAQEERFAQLTDDNQISYLLSRRKEDLKRVQERLVSGGVEYRQPTFALGAMAYWQGYENSFVNPQYTRDLEAISLAGTVKSKIAEVSGEAALVEGDGVIKAIAAFSLPRVEQSLGFSYHRNLQIPAYAAKPFLLSNGGERQELSWLMDFPVTDNLNLGLAYALLRRINSLQTSSWRSRSIVSVTYKPEYTRVHAQLTRLDKEIVAEEYDSYTNTLPTHLRGKLQINQDINKNFELTVLFRYHHEDKLKSENNSFFWENVITWKFKALRLEAGLQSWQSLHTLITPEDELSDPDGIMVATSEDNQAFAGLKFRWRSVHINAEIHQSWLDAKRSVYLGIGI
ncbi:MAG: hypothetical protein PHO32_10715 [Candidatus Cloacimonetes bacterium]|nr:hypothetical protein [Candidatus Cloacimonadota bacterium]